MSPRPYPDFHSAAVINREEFSVKIPLETLNWP
jgi:hypothetical protein